MFAEYICRVLLKLGTCSLRHRHIYQNKTILDKKMINTIYLLICKQLCSKKYKLEYNNMRILYIESHCNSHHEHNVSLGHKNRSECIAKSLTYI